MSRALSASARRWWVALAAAVGVAVTASLGFWQLGRAELKAGLWTQREAREALAPVGWEALDAVQPGDDASGLHDRRAALQGRWLHEATVFLDNRPMNGRSGFIVVTPLLPSHGGPALLVQRGWVPRRMDDRTALPPVPQPDGTVAVAGRLAPAPSQLYAFGEDAPGPIRQNIHLSVYGAEWSLRLHPLSLQQSAPDTPDGMTRDWPRVGADVHKHYGYALQWFGLGALITILYVWFQILVPRRRRG